jgi:hypothetical protein
METEELFYPGHEEFRRCIDDCFENGFGKGRAFSAFRDVRV